MSAIMDGRGSLAPQPASEAANEPANEPAAQPDFDQINQSLQTFTAEMSLLPNLPAINNQLAQTRHEELVRLIGRRMDHVDVLLDRLERRMTVK
jgi:hypothetical protein